MTKPVPPAPSGGESQSSAQAAHALIVVLAAGRPFRGTAPTILELLPDKRTLFAWLKDSFRTLPGQFRIVAGYRFEEVATELNGLEIAFEPAWERKGATGSMLKGILPNNPCFVTYADIMFRSVVVETIDAHQNRADVVVAVDTHWRQRFSGRSARDVATAEKVVLDGTSVVRAGSDLTELESNSEFIGLAHFSANAVAMVRSLADLRPECGTWSLSKLIDELVRNGLSVKAVDVRGEWASLDEPEDMARFIHGSKARTLSRLQRLMRKSTVPPGLIVRLDDWRERQSDVLSKLTSGFGNRPVAVRSSGTREDGWCASMAGKYRTELNIPSSDKVALACAIESVFHSYGESPNSSDEVLVQAMVTDVTVSGVVLTRTLQRGAPYFQVNYDASSDSTNRITQGMVEAGQLLKCHHSSLEAMGSVAPELEALPGALKELTNLLGYDNLDVEFAISGQDKFNLLQVRPIASHAGDWRGTDHEVETSLCQAELTFTERIRPGVGVVGARTAYSVMTDWNPAEMIGVRPRQLAFDLYRFLLTDSIWSRQRAEFGYRDLAPTPLMVAFAGHAYIDVRACLNSFIPARVSEDMATQIVEAQMDILVASPELHDKLEFQVAMTCIDFLGPARRHQMNRAGIPEVGLDAWMRELTAITRAAMDSSRLDTLDEALLTMEARRELRADGPALRQAFSLLHDCRTFGTLAFAHYARHAFIVKALLSSASKAGVVGTNADQRFANSLNTVARQFIADSLALNQGTIAPTDFIRDYGHLRPGTYEITVPTYAETMSRFKGNYAVTEGASVPPGGLEDAEWSALSKALAALDLPHDVKQIKIWMRRAIEGRERAKFLFTKNVSMALELIGRFGADCGIDRETLSHVGLFDLDAVANGLGLADCKSWLADRAAQNRAAHHQALRMELPPVIFSARDLRVFRLTESHPNFAGLGRVIAEPVMLDGMMQSVDLKGKIVMLLGADPGYEWIFACGLVGLVTAYGGANSHMTIRAAELNLPAAIGIGEVRFDQLRGARLLLIDGGARRLQALK